MIFRNPEVEIITEENPLKRIERAARVCYKSEGKITEDSALPLIKKLIARGHMTPLEHARVVLDARNVLPRSLEVAWGPEPYGFRDRIGHPEGDMDIVYASVRDLLAAGYELDDVVKLPNASDYMTVRFICDRAIANELVRHRVFSFSQESSRFCCYSDNVTFINPIPLEGYLGGMKKWGIFFDAVNAAEKAYKQLIKEGASPQEARNVLPLCTKTELIMTGMLGDWDRLIKMRSAKDAHPQMQYLMGLLQQVYKKK
jgi:thymidylate synthase ThyX